MSREEMSGTCRICEGPIYRHAAIGSPISDPEPTGPWLHLRDEDWSERYGKTPHNAEPGDDPLAYVRSLIANDVDLQGPS